MLRQEFAFQYLFFSFLPVDGSHTGVRGSQSLDLRTIKLYCFGLVVCAIVAISIRIEVLYDVFSGKVRDSRVNFEMVGDPG